ncbi:MAG: glycosyltransferase [Eggerthellaceae bacterium]|nr:glycosyltransferase [Eggerthellaceae bacterium]
MDDRENNPSPLVSVIVPVYRTEAYLPACVGSILAQTHRELDVVLVDDGSDDGAGAICDAYAARDGRVRVVHQQNGGLSEARNAGLEAARGGWILFVDSDDAILPTMVEELLGAALEADADIAECLFVPVRDDSFDAAMALPPEQADERNRIVIEPALESMLDPHWEGRPLAVQWNKLFKRSIFQDLRFPSGKYNEDEYVIHRELAAARRLVRVPKVLYLYRRHPNAIMANPKPINHLYSCEALLDRIQFSEEIGRYDLMLKSSLSLAYYPIKLMVGLGSFGRSPEVDRAVRKLGWKGWGGLFRSCRHLLFGRKP